MDNCSEYLKLLDDRAAQMSEDFSKHHADCDAAIRKAFEHLVWTVTHVPIHEHRREIAAAALTSRILQQAHAADNLLRSGNLSSAAVILRSLLESLFAVAGLARDTNFAGGRDFFMRLRYKAAHADCQAIKKFLSTASSLSEKQREALAEKQANLEKWMAEHKQHAMATVREVAEAADMLDFYAREYAWQSKSSHSDIEDVVNTHVIEKGGKITLVAAVASHEYAPGLAAQLATILMETAVALAKMFSLKLPPEAVQQQSEVTRRVGELFQKAVEQ